MPKLPPARPSAANDPARPETSFMAEVVQTSFDIYGAIYDGLRDAMTDIAKKLEELVWGREVSSREIDITREPISMETRLGWRELIEIQAAMVSHTPDQAAQARQEPNQGPEI